MFNESQIGFFKPLQIRYANIFLQPRKFQIRLIVTFSSDGLESWQLAFDDDYEFDADLCNDRSVGLLHLQIARYDKQRTSSAYMARICDLWNCNEVPFWDKNGILICYLHDLCLIDGWSITVDYCIRRQMFLFSVLSQSQEEVFNRSSQLIIQKYWEIPLRNGLSSNVWYVAPWNGEKKTTPSYFQIFPRDAPSFIFIGSLILHHFVLSSYYQLRW